MECTIQTTQSKASGNIRLIDSRHQTSQGEHATLLLQIHASSSEAKAVQQECQNIVKHALLETEGDGAKRLDSTLKELNGLFKGLMLSRKIDDVHAILALVDQDYVLHVSHAGRAEAYVIRAGMASQITEYTRGKPTPAFVHIASGSLEPKDAVIFSTQRLLRTFTPAQLANLTQEEGALSALVSALESENEPAALALVRVIGGSGKYETTNTLPTTNRSARQVGRVRRTDTITNNIVRGLSDITGVFKNFFGSILKVPKGGSFISNLKKQSSQVVSALNDPKNKRRSHLLLLAGVIAVFLVVWVVVNLSTYQQRSQTKAELEVIIQEVESQLAAAENRRLTGQIEAANAILDRSAKQAQQVMDSDSQLFRAEAHELLSQIRAKQEDINNITRLVPREVVNLAAKNPDITAIGMVGLNNGEFVVYDPQASYRVLLNSVESPVALSGEAVISDGTPFDRYKSQVFQTKSNGIIELINGQPTIMKTEDPSGWIVGQDIEAYLRYLYVLSPENNQIYKYERYSNRYSAPTEYRVSGDVSDAVDMTIDGNVYLLKEGGAIMRLYRGEDKAFAIRNLPEGMLDKASHIFKVFDGKLYIMDARNKHIVVVAIGDREGEASYLRQYVLEGEIGTLQDLYVDEDETQLYVLDEKKLYAVDLSN